MLHRSMTVCADEDPHRAAAIIQEDDVIDKCYSGLYDEAVNQVLGDPRNIERANYRIWVAHNLERVGNRATNICESVVFMVSGERPPEMTVMENFAL